MNKRFTLVMASIVAVAFTSTVSADLLYDNGGPDGTGGYSNILTAGLNLDRRIADDFNLGAGPGWLVDNVQMNYVWGTVGNPGTATDFLVEIWVDDGLGDGPNGSSLVSQQVSTDFTATETGDVYFSRAEILFSVDIDPVALDADTNYWLSIQPNGDDNGFQLTSAVPHQNGSDLYVNYPDLGGPVWITGAQQFGPTTDINFKVNGEVIPAPGALALLGFAGLFAVRRRRCAGPSLRLLR